MNENQTLEVLSEIRDSLKNIEANLDSMNKMIKQIKVIQKMVWENTNGISRVEKKLDTISDELSDISLDVAGISVN